MDHNYNYNHRYTSTREDSKLTGSPLPFALALLGGGAVIFCLWYFFFAGTSAPVSKDVPIVKAEATPMKVKPDSASQPEVPHQDKLVYSRVNPAEQGKGVERLLPVVEEPVEMAAPEVQSAPEDSFPSPNTKVADKADFRTEPSSQVALAATAQAPADLPQKAEAVQEANVTVDRIPGTLVPEPQAEEEQQPAVEAVTKLEQKAPATKTLQSGYRVQLASMRSQDHAKDEWRRLQGEHKSILGSLTPTYSRVDLGAKKGIYYRVQAGDFADKTEAQNVCTSLKAQNPNLGCLIVKF